MLRFTTRKPTVWDDIKLEQQSNPMSSPSDNSASPPEANSVSSSPKHKSSDASPHQNSSDSSAEQNSITAGLQHDSADQVGHDDAGFTAVYCKSKAARASRANFQDEFAWSDETQCRADCYLRRRMLIMYNGRRVPDRVILAAVNRRLEAWCLQGNPFVKQADRANLRLCMPFFQYGRCVEENCEEVHFPGYERQCLTRYVQVGWIRNHFPGVTWEDMADTLSKRFHARVPDKRNINRNSSVVTLHFPSLALARQALAQPHFLRSHAMGRRVPLRLSVVHSAYTYRWLNSIDDNGTSSSLAGPMVLNSGVIWVESADTFLLNQKIPPKPEPSQVEQLAEIGRGMGALVSQSQTVS